MKKVIFFDGDGTLWYPKSTLWTRKPHWVYLDKAVTDPVAEFVTTPRAIETLALLGQRGIKRVLLSTSPLPEEEAIMHRIRVTQHVEINHLLDDVQVAPDYPEGKGERITALLEQYRLQKEDALMVGDMFRWDYKSAQEVGVEALLIKTDYQDEFADDIELGNVITSIHDLIDRLD